MNKFYLYSQNNSGGSFITNENVAHRVFIEAKSGFDANEKAEFIGIYFDGVSDGIDCECCGDRWYEHDELSFPKEHSLSLSAYQNESESVLKAEFMYKYAHLNPVDVKYSEKTYGSNEYKSLSKTVTGKIIFKTVTEYAQYMTDEYGCTSPDVIIHYINGSKQEINKTS